MNTFRSIIESFRGLGRYKAKQKAGRRRVDAVSRAVCETLDQRLLFTFTASMSAP